MKESKWSVGEFLFVGAIASALVITFVLRWTECLLRLTSLFEWMGSFF